MAKLYFTKSDISQCQELDEKLLNIVEHGIARLEKQGSFRSFYDIEIMGVTIYYRKNWRYDRLSQKVNQKEVESAVIGA
jgi:hypothetical protein